jgi:hypothetical protein
VELIHAVNGEGANMSNENVIAFVINHFTEVASCKNPRTGKAGKVRNLIGYVIDPDGVRKSSVKLACYDKQIAKAEKALENVPEGEKLVLSLTGVEYEPFVGEKGVWHNIRAFQMVGTDSIPAQRQEFNW